MSCNWNDFELYYRLTINWRASLVPAAAVIPAPKAYIKIVAVKKLVVGSLSSVAGLPPGHVSGTTWTYLWAVCLHLTVWHGA